MEQASAAALREGFALAAANARLARELQLQWGALQRAEGRSSWPAAAIATLDAWLERVWTEAGGDRLLLTAAQEQRLWEEIVVSQGGALLAPAAAARAAATAWELSHAWQLDLDDQAWELSDDTAAFRGWARTFAAQCRQSGYITAAELPDAAAEAILRRKLKAPRLLLIGFDRLTPQQQALQAAARATGGAMEEAPRPATAKPAAVRSIKARNAEHELALAAAWARALLDGGASGSIGVVIADLGEQRAAAERAFLAALHPGREPGAAGPTAFHISLGPPLAEHPIAGCALLMLETWLVPPPVAAGPALRWLRSPYLSGAEGEAQRRAAWERRRRNEERAWWSWQELEQRARDEACPESAALLRACRTARDAWPERQAHGGWAASFGALLEVAGWPGERALTSAEHQAARAWAETLDEFRRLDQVSATPIGAGEALRRLRGLAAARIFQPQAAAAPVQILGWLEAAGQRFEHVWVAGLHDGALPAPAAPHPFLPMHWQRQHAMPRASAITEAEFAGRLWRRLQESAEYLIASWPATEDDLTLRSSPLLEGLTMEDMTGSSGATRAGAAPIETMSDGVGPAAVEASGGSQLFADQAACPFRAFAHWRLGATAAPQPPTGLAATTRGSLLHAALDAFWGKVTGSQELRAMTVEERLEAARNAAESAVAAEPRLRHQPALAALEAARLARTMMAWLAEEEKRPAFTVMEREKKHNLSFNGIALHLKSDRLDELEAGALELLDYKSGKVSARDWQPPRMNAPQLPLYYATHPECERIASVAFAQLKPGAMRLVEASPTEVWLSDLEDLAAAFRAGEAAVDPKKPGTTCATCDVGMLCRIGDQAPEQGPAELDAGADGQDEDDDGEASGD